MTPFAAKVAAVVVVAVAAAGVAYAVTGSSASGAPVEARAWIDAPLDGATLAEGRVVVTAHATDPDGVAAVALSADGHAVTTRRTGGGRLETVELAWTAPAGEHVLRVVGRDPGGHEGSAARVTVVVGTPRAGPSGPTTTVVPSPSTSTGTTTSSTTTTTTTTTTTPGTASPSTAAPGTTAPPATVAPTSTTTAPCSVAAPTPTSPADGASTTDRTPTFRWTHAGCVSVGFRIELSRENQFTRVEHAADLGAGARSWTVPDLLPCATTWYWRVGARPAGGGSPVWSSRRSFSVLCRA